MGPKIGPYIGPNKGYNRVGGKRGGVGWGCYCPGTGPWSQNQNLHFNFAPRILALRARALYREIKDKIMEIKEINEFKEIKEIDEINETKEINEINT